MDPEETNNTAPADTKHTGKPRAGRKPTTRKRKEEATQPAPDTAAAPAAKAPRKQRSNKKAPAPAAEPPADSAAVEPATKKARTPKKSAAKPAPVAQAPAAPAPQQTEAPKPAPQPVATQAPKPAPQPAPAPAPQPAPAPRPVPADDMPDLRDFPAPEPAPGFSAPETVGGNEGGTPGGKNRRKRRRNRNRNRDNDNQAPQARLAPAVNPDELVRRAWKIYLGEVTEEGLALMDDRTAAEASRRAFRVAELFLIEAARHRKPLTPPEAEQELPEDGEEENE